MHSEGGSTHPHMYNCCHMGLCMLAVQKHLSSPTFAAAVPQGGLEGTCFSRISPGEYIQAGRQGARRQGEVEGVAGLTVSFGTLVLEARVQC